MADQLGKLRVFVSWSTPLSQAVAIFLRDWLPRVIQDIDLFVSSEDIEKGTYWQQTINTNLQGSSIGIIVVTPANSDRPWLNFEAGALTRAIDHAGGVVAPFLVNMSGSSINGPLTLLQLTNSDIKDEVYKLLEAINNRTRSPLQEKVLAEEFEEKWPKLQDGIKAAIKADPIPVAKEERNSSEVLEEILSTVRTLAQQNRETASRSRAGDLNARMARLLRQSRIQPGHVSSPGAIDDLTQALVTAQRPEDILDQYFRQFALSPAEMEAAFDAFLWLRPELKEDRRLAAGFISRLKQYQEEYDVRQSRIRAEAAIRVATSYISTDGGDEEDEQRRREEDDDSELRQQMGLS